LVAAMLRAGFQDAFRAATICTAAQRDPDLARAMSDFLVDGPRSLGRFLQRLQREGDVEQVHTDGHGGLWRIERSDSGDSGDAAASIVVSSKSR
jgi:hypothetical protein